MSNITDKCLVATAALAITASTVYLASRPSPSPYLKKLTSTEELKREKDFYSSDQFKKAPIIDKIFYVGGNTIGGTLLPTYQYN